MSTARNAGEHIFEPLLTSASIEIYHNNAFRISGLSVDATDREVRKHINNLKGLEEVGQADLVSRHAFALKPPPTSDQIRTAMQRLSHPELRLVDELFWFWPLEFGQSAKDKAIQALRQGKAAEAHTIWREAEAHAQSRATAQHNLAVMYHLAALDQTIGQLSGTGASKSDEQIENYWRYSFHYWESITPDKGLWKTFSKRALLLHDPRITPESIDQIRQSLPLALDKINADAAAQFMAAGNKEWAKLHIRFMKETHEGKDDVERISVMTLESSKKTLEVLIANAQAAVEENPSNGVKIAGELVKECLPLHEMFDMFHEDSHHKTELFDTAVQTVLQCCRAWLQSPAPIGMLANRVPDPSKGPGQNPPHHPDLPESSLGIEYLKQAQSLTLSWDLFEELSRCIEDLKEFDVPPPPPPGSHTPNKTQHTLSQNEETNTEKWCQLCLKVPAHQCGCQTVTMYEPVSARPQWHEGTLYDIHEFQNRTVRVYLCNNCQAKQHRDKNRGTKIIVSSIVASSIVLALITTSMAAGLFMGLFVGGGAGFLIARGARTDAETRPLIIKQLIKKGWTLTPPASNVSYASR